METVLSPDDIAHYEWFRDNREIGLSRAPKLRGTRQEAVAIMRVQTIVADDEVLARRKLRQMLDANPGLEVVGEGATAFEVLDMVRETRPQLLFLDVCMPGMDGFALLDQINAMGGSAVPRVIFTTAYDRHAIRAFEMNAVDYLLKPFTEDRLRIAVDRACEAIAGSATRAPQEDAAPANGRAYSSRIVFRSRGRIVFLPASEIRWIGAEENYVRINTANESHLLRHTFSDMEAKLDPNTFLRVHRSAIVNLQYVREVCSEQRGEYAVILRDGRRVPMSRSYHGRILQKLYSERRAG